MAKNRAFRYDAASVVRAGTSRSRGPGSEPETVRTGTASARRMAPARRRGERGPSSRGRRPAVTNGRSLTGEAEVVAAMRRQDRVAPRALVPRSGEGYLFPAEAGHGSCQRPKG